VSADASLPDLEHLPDAQAAVAGDASGRLLVTTEEREVAVRSASRTAETLRALEALGPDASLGALGDFVVRGASQTTVTVVRAGVFVQARLDPAHGTLQVERALGEWRLAPAAAAGSGGPEDGRPGATDLAAAVVEAAAPAALSAAASPPDPWSTLRRTLVRGQLTEASGLREALGRDLPEGTALAGAEPLEAPQRERGVDSLLEGIGSVLTGDAWGGLRILKEVAVGTQPNRSIRWLALHWSTLGSLQCSNTSGARWFARQGVLLSRELDQEAQAVSQWAAAELLVAEGDGAKALDWVAQARIRFERLGDTWGLGRVCFTEAQVLAAMGRDEEATEAARRARTYDAAWDEPPIFLAHRALQRQALDEAEEMVRMVGTASAERIRLIAQAVRHGVLPHPDAVELLQHLRAAPSVEAIRALERLARAAPGLPVPREALAWMLLKAGKYADAGKHFTALAAARLTPAIRSSVMLGMGCVAHAQQGGERPEARLRAAVEAGGEAGATEASSAAPLSSSVAAAIAVAPGAMFSGKLNVFAVPDLLEFLRGARRTGLLLLSGAAGTAALRFREGRIAGAASPATPGVGELLVRARKLSPVVLQAVLDRQGGRARSDGVLGELLAREGTVEPEDVRRALRQQIGLAVKEIIGWRDGEFAFNREEPGGEAEIAVEVDPQEVLLNTLKELDEASRSRVLP
jgi:tetratricopeptide (TPR) repeat protein